ncbi:MAG TPA: hypothetical protein DCX21_07085 [Eubacterium sp.]|nr:hypothetical protein [Eubacterium sp.]
MNKRTFHMIGLTVLRVFLGMSGVFYALLFKEVIDNAVAHKLSAVKKYCIYLVIMVIMILLIRAVARFIEELIRSTYENELKLSLYEDILRRDYAAVKSKHDAEWMNRLTSDTKVVADGMTDIIPGIAEMGIRTLSAMIAIICMKPSFLWPALCGGVCMLLFSGVFRKLHRKFHKDVQEAEGRVRISLLDHIESLDIIKAYAKEEVSVKDASLLMNNHKKSRLKRQLLSAITSLGFSGIVNGAYFAGVIYGAYSLYMGTMSYGTLMALLTLINQFQMPLSSISGFVPRYYACKESRNRLSCLSGCPLDKSSESLGKCDAIVCDGVTFAYGEEDVLSGITLEIKRGEKIGIYGMSGYGKSTLLRLMLGLYPLKSGRMFALIDGHEQMIDSSTRGLFSYVSQDFRLMSGSIRKIVTYEDVCDEERLKKALDVACCDFVYELEDGLDTVIGDGGKGLSGGQMQRLSIARAVYADRQIMILDECTSALDSDIRKRVLENLSGLEGKTYVYVTHQEDVLSICDRCYKI